MVIIITTKEKIMRIRKENNENSVPDRSSLLEVFCKEGVLKNFTKFTGKHLCQSLFFNNVAGLQLY